MDEKIKNETMKHLTQTLSDELSDKKIKELYQLFEKIYEMILSKSLSCEETNTILECVKIAVNNTPLTLNDGQALINALRKYVCKYD